MLDWYHDLAAARGGNGFGINPLTFTEIDSWARLAHIELTPSEVALLRAIDTALLRVIGDGGPASN